MRVVFYGLCDLTLKTVKKFIEDEHEVVIIHPDREVAEEASESLDCGILVGEASSPAIIDEVNPKKTDLFFALSENSQNNMVACLVAKSKGIKRTILRVDDPDYHPVCEELGLTEVIIPSQISSQYLFDVIFNEHLLDLFDFMKDKVFLYKVTISEEEKDISSLNLNSSMRVICYFRDGDFNHIKEGVRFKKGDEVILLTDRHHMNEVIEQFTQ